MFRRPELIPLTVLGPAGVASDPRLAQRSASLLTIIVKETVANGIKFSQPICSEWIISVKTYALKQL